MTFVILIAYVYKNTTNSMSRCEQCIVRELSSLKALNKEELSTIAASKTKKIIKKGDVIFEEGDNVNGIFCVRDGIAKLTKLSANGKDHIVKLVKKGELLGQRSMISDEPVNLTAVALEDMNVCFIPKPEVMGFFDKNNQFSMNVMKSICHDLKDADDIMVNLAQKHVKQRLAIMLLYLNETFGIDDDNTLKISLSRDELSSLIGTATESCIRLLSEFNKENLIELIGKKIKLKDIVKLKKIAG